MAAGRGRPQLGLWCLHAVLALSHLLTKSPAGAGPQLGPKTSRTADLLIAQGSCVSAWPSCLWPPAPNFAKAWTAAEQSRAPGHNPPQKRTRWVQLETVAKASLSPGLS